VATISSMPIKKFHIHFSFGSVFTSLYIETDFWEKLGF